MNTSRRYAVAACSALLLTLATSLMLGCGKGGTSPTAPGGGTSNHAPSVYITGTPTRFPMSSNATFTTTASDPDGDQLSFAYTPQNGTVSVSGSTATSGTLVATTRGNVSLTVTASDGHGGSANATASFYCYSPDQPVISISRISGACSMFTLTVPETLEVTHLWTERVRNGVSHLIDNDFVLGAIPAHQSAFITPDDCEFLAGDSWIVSLTFERPHDGVEFYFSKRWN